MRKIWKLRRLLIPQAVMLLCAVLTFAVGAAQAKADSKLVTATITDKYGDVVTVKTNSTQLDLSTIMSKEKLAEAEEKNIAAAIKLIAKPLQYDDAIHAALAKHGLTAGDIHKWIEQHPKTALKEVEKMPPALQAKVANIATFIRSVNGNIGKKTVWREAAAIVHYCAKYNISTELATGVAKAESTFNPGLTSKAGALGVMQVVWKYHGGMLQAKGIAATKEQMFDPERGIEAGVLLLSRYVDAYGSVQKALNRYYGKVSTVYVKKIDKNVAMLEKHSSNSGF